MIEQFFSQSIETLLLIINQLGYLGIFLGMTIESSFFPFPSEIILIPAGALVAQGKMSFLLVLLAGILGSLVGAFINFFLALYLGRTTVEFLLSKYGKVLFLSKKSLEFGSGKNIDVNFSIIAPDSLGIFTGKIKSSEQ